MKIVGTSMDDVKLVEPDVFGDERGCFFEGWNRARYEEAGIRGNFVQDNISFSQEGTLRGLHFQNPHAQCKLISVLKGEIFDVAVDIRIGSPTFGKWMGEYLAWENKKQIYIPEGFAHGFLVTKGPAIVQYKCTDFYHPECEASIRYDDPDIGVGWPSGPYTVSAKDSVGKAFAEIDRSMLFEYAAEQD
jgi:dTDP-4-dehydrorhamnose 3,5-epimerase